ncbi:MAG: ABC transporter substrate-binding protein [Vicinamibacterales bacterium]
MRIGLGAPSQGSPAAGVSTLVSFLTDDTWLAAKVDGGESERIATRWKWDASGTTLRLSLRPNVFFHDDTLLTPELAAESLRSSVTTHAAFSFSDVTSVSASGPDSVDIRLSKPDSFLVPDLTAVRVEKPGKTSATTGPFAVVNRNSNEISLRAYSRYYRGQPSLSEIDLRTYPSQRSAWAALRRGDVDMLYEVSREAAEFVKQESTVNLYSFARPYYISLVFNVRHPALRNAEVRKALNEALDRAALVRDGMNGWGQRADGPIPPAHWAYSGGTPFPFDPGAARARLDAAGYRMKSPVSDEVPRRFTFKCLVYTGDSRFEHLAILIQKQLADVGVDMQLVPVKDALDLGTRLGAGDFDAFLFELTARPLSWTYEFWHSQEGLLNTGYRAADAALDRLRGSRSDDEVRAAVAELTRVMHDDPPAAFLAWQTSLRAVSTRFDVAPEKDRDVYSNVWQWHLANPDERSRR